MLTQRLGYKSWLHVYAKEESVVTAGMAELIDAYTASYFSSTLITYADDTLERTG
jgi:hypothetical protein